MVSEKLGNDPVLNTEIGKKPSSGESQRTPAPRHNPLLNTHDDNPITTPPRPRRGPSRWAHPLLVVGDDAADKVGVGVPQGGHEVGQLLLVQLAHRAEHALLGLVGGTERCVAHASHLVQAHDAVHWRGGRGREGGRERRTRETGVVGRVPWVQRLTQ